MGKDHPRAANHLVNGPHGVEIAVVARGLRARLVATVDDDKLRSVVKQELEGFLRQGGGVGQPGDPAMGRFQQVAESEL